MYMRRFELTFTFLQLPLDYALIVLAGFSAYYLRYSEFVTSIRPILFNFSWNKYWPIVLVVAAGWIVIFALNDLYSTTSNRRILRDLNRVIISCSAGFAAIALYVFFTLQKFDSRFLVLVSWMLAMLYVIAGRLIMQGIKRIFYHYGMGLRRIIIVGQEKVAQTIKNNLANNPRLGYAVLATLPAFNSAATEKILALRPDEIIFADPRADESGALAAIDFANAHHITFKYSADLFATISSNMTVSTIAGIPIIELRRTRLSGWNTVTKRLLDIAGSIILIIILSPLFLLSALGVIIETGSPIIYRNERVGRRGRKFIAYKFRSMYQKYCTGDQFGDEGAQALATEAELIKTNNAKTGPVYKIKDDPRVTRWGRFIRAWSLDELPQLFNVLIGNMSLVGPRPHQPREVAQYAAHHQLLLAIKPGVTGLSQISGRSDLSFEDEARLDTFYIEHWSLWLDLIIIIKTPFTMLTRQGAW